MKPGLKQRENQRHEVQANDASFYAPDFAGAEEFELDQIQSRHIAKVLRYKKGENLSVFDGNGTELECEISAISKRVVTLKVLREIEPRCPESPLKITLGIPLLKGNKTDLIVHKAVELGVAELAPFHSQRCDVPIKKWNTERAEKIAVEASKQCGRATLPFIRKIAPFETMVGTLNSRGLLFYEEESSQSTFSGSEESVFLVTGPEGGFEVSEIETAKESGFEVIHFGGRILKAETAAIVATALAQHHFGDLN